MHLGIIILSGFLSVLLFRPFLQGHYIHPAEEMDQPKRIFILDFSLCFAAGILINVYNALTLDVPFVNLTSMTIGCTIAGFFIGLDSSLNQQQKVIHRALAKMPSLHCQNVFLR